VAGAVWPGWAVRRDCSGWGMGQGVRKLVGSVTIDCIVRLERQASVRDREVCRSIILGSVGRSHGIS